MPLFGRKDEPTIDPRVAELAEAVVQREDSLDLLQERLAELEFALEDEGWVRLGLEGQREFSRSGLKRIAAMSRLMYLKNPLIQRGINVKTYYVWGQGVQIQARDDTVNTVLQRFLDDPGNRDELTGHQARMLKEIDLGVEGNVFLTLFPSIKTGHVRVRSIVPDEIADIWTNPEDTRERWYYVRRWTQRTINSVGQYETKALAALYPDWRYRPRNRPASYGGLAINWESPVYHVRVGGLSGMRFGVPETYSSLDWARAYKDFLTDWATLVRSLSKFAWRMTTAGRNVKAAKKKLATTLDLDNLESNPPPTAGSAFVGTDAVNIEPIPKTGATTSAEDGKQLRLMVASAMDIPDTILSGDPDQGNLATAKTLDRPTELAMSTRQTLWADVFRDLCLFVIRANVLATRGKLTGTVNVDEDGIETIELTGLDDDALTIDITFPEILEHDTDAAVTAIVNAATLGGHVNANVIDNTTLVRLLLTALGVDDVDELVDDIVDTLDNEPDDPANATEEAFAEALRDLRAAITAR
jgi:hypothetical protein